MDAVKDSLTQGYNTAKCPLSTAPPNDAYLHWDALGVEVIEPDQEAKSQQIADTINKMQKRYFDKHRHALRNPRQNPKPGPQPPGF